MRLAEFRLQHYKKVRDTGWVKTGDLTAFVGKNEAGKSAIFRGLSKLNPSDGQKYDGLKEFPRRRYADEFKLHDWPAASARFALDPEEQKELLGICPALAGVTHAECTRHYSFNLTVGFLPPPKAQIPTRAQLAAALEAAVSQINDLTAPDGKGEAVGTMKSALIGPLTEARRAQQSQPSAQAISSDEAQAICNVIATQSNEGWQKELLAPVIKPFQALTEGAKLQSQLQAARVWIHERMPGFIYFDRYDVLESAVHLPTFVQQLGSSPNAPRVRTTKCLFEHVGLDVQRLAGLGRHNTGQAAEDSVRRLVDERAIHFSSASNAMTQKFSD